MHTRTRWKLAGTLLASVLAAAMGCGALLHRRHRAVAPATKVASVRPPEPQISAALRDIADLTRSQARLKEVGEHVHRLGNDLAWIDQEALCDWLRQPRPAHFSGPGWQWLVNEAMDKLCRQAKPSPKLTAVLVAVYRDPAADFVSRDYAIQHLAHYLQPPTIWEAREEDARARQLISETLAAAAATDESIAGTALQGMHLAMLAAERHLHPTPGQTVAPAIGVWTREQLRAAALSVIRTPGRHPAARITALQICAERRFEEVLPDARRIVAQADALIPLRVSAIHALSQLGQPEDLALLEGLSKEKDPRVARAADLAFHRLQGAPAS